MMAKDHTDFGSRMFKYTSGSYSGHGTITARPWGLEIELVPGEHDIIVVWSTMQSGDTMATVTDAQVDSPIRSFSFGCRHEAFTHWLLWYIEQFNTDFESHELTQAIEDWEQNSGMLG